MSSRPRPPLLPASSSSPPASRADDPRLPISAAPLSAALNMSRPASRADALISEIAAALLSDASDMPVPALCATACTVSNSLWASCNCALKRFTFNIKLTTSSPAFILKSFFMVYIRACRMVFLRRRDSPDAMPPFRPASAPVSLVKGFNPFFVLMRRVLIFSCLKRPLCASRRIEPCLP